MPAIKTIKDVQVVGGDRPDFTQEIHIGKFFKDIELKPNEKLKYFMISLDEEESPFPWVVPPLEPGKSLHLVDAETGLSLPFETEAGYNLKVIKYWAGVSQHFTAKMYIDGNFVDNLILTPGFVYVEQEVELFEVTDFDPSLTSGHSVDVIVRNDGNDYLRGTGIVIAKYIKVGSPEITTKKVRCKWCGHTQEVPLETTKLECPKCGRVTKYYAFLFGGRYKLR